MLKPQAHGNGLEFDGTTCALGAALDAVGSTASRCSDESYNDLQHRWPFLSEKAIAPCGCLDRNRERTLCHVWHLNDGHRWTREQIADWIATIEPSDVLTERTEAAASVYAVDPSVGDPGKLTTRV